MAPNMTGFKKSYKFMEEKAIHVYVPLEAVCICIKVFRNPKCGKYKVWCQSTWKFSSAGPAQLHNLFMSTSTYAGTSSHVCVDPEFQAVRFRQMDVSVGRSKIVDQQ
ncbi:Hypothetical predicted protein [Podarcis lilfordi]|uniref:Uncharacterized protein n=1 Tax=Podarcis lilfordi TaxID=74358 RepID=A0AA35L1R4_9SAUR|nr:Hypothetical predicted protein [Podarcis lilfordi]